MTSRYDTRRTFTTTKEESKHLLEDRGISRATFYSSPVFGLLGYSEYANITESRHIWSIGDRLYKLSYKHYGSTEYWWVIARYNNKPTDSHFKLGDKVIIPQPLNYVLDMYGV